MRYLISTTENYRVDTESEVNTLINEAKESPLYDVVKYTSQYKEVKQKGEVIDNYYKVTITKSIDNEKEPTNDLVVKYGNEGDFNED
jgi:hypothetical protein